MNRPKSIMNEDYDTPDDIPESQPLAFYISPPIIPSPDIPVAEQSEIMNAQFNHDLQTNTLAEQSGTLNAPVSLDPETNTKIGQLTEENLKDEKLLTKISEAINVSILCAFYKNCKVGLKCLRKIDISFLLNCIFKVVKAKIAKIAERKAQISKIKKICTCAKMQISKNKKCENGIIFTVEYLYD